MHPRVQRRARSHSWMGLALRSGASTCLVFEAACGASANNQVSGKYVGMLTGDTVGTSRSVIELRADGGVRWAMGTQGASYAVRADTVFVDLASGVPTVIPLVIRGDSLIWRDKESTYGIWLRAAR